MLHFSAVICDLLSSVLWVRKAAVWGTAREQQIAQPGS